MSNWKKVEVTDKSTFDTVVEDEASSASVEGKTLFVMITTEFTGEGNQRWCPDCRKADPIVYGALDKKGNSVLVEAPVARSEYKGNADYVYRKHPKLAITAVPTLINWSTQERLVEGECYDESKIKAFFGL